MIGEQPVSVLPSDEDRKRWEQESKLKQEKAERAVAKYPGLAASLNILTDVNHEKMSGDPSFSYEEIVGLVVSDGELRESIKDFQFSHDDNEAVVGFKSKLGWSVADELASRVNQK